MRYLAVALPLCLLLAGCIPTGSSPDPGTPQPSPPAADPTPPVTATPHTEAPFIQIASDARAQLKKIAEDQKVQDRWWLRITIKPGSCTGMRSSLDFDTAGPEPGDAEFRCGDVRCLSAARHDFLIQGVCVGWTQKEKESGFTVAFPNKTAENQKRTLKWIEEQAEARQARSGNQAK